MAFYQSIADHYDDIFPLNPAQVNFVLERLDSGNMKILDVGCGTGNLCIALTSHFKHITGIDPDNSMLEKAKLKAGELQNISWHPHGMLELERQYGENSIDAVLCFGNTLVHLASEIEIAEFLRQAKHVLKPGGKLMIQVINYDRILGQEIKGLPTIENDRIQFVRNYHWDTDGEPVNFETILTIKSTGQAIRNSIPLYPLRKQKLEGLLINAGFRNIQFYGNFKREPFHPDSIPLVITADL